MALLFEGSLKSETLLKVCHRTINVRRPDRARNEGSAEISCEKAFGLKLSGNDIYYTNSLILQVKNMLCSKVHGYKVLIQKPFHMRSLKT